MQETLRALRALQELDKDIFGVRQELKRLPEELARRVAEIDRLEVRKKTADSVLADLRVRIKEIEDHTTIQRQRMRKVETEASKSRGDMSLLAAFQHQVKSLKREIGSAEEEGLELVEQADTHQATANELIATLEEVRTVFEEYRGNAEREIAEAEKRLAAFEKERGERLGSDMDAEVLLLYDRLLAARGGVAMAELDGRICQGCFIEVPTNRYVRVVRGQVVTQCPSCDRILFTRGSG